MLAMTMNIKNLINYEIHKEFAIETLECLAFDMALPFLPSLNYAMGCIFHKTKC